MLLPRPAVMLGRMYSHLRGESSDISTCSSRDPDEFVAHLLSRKWFLPRPDTLIQPVLVSRNATQVHALTYSCPKKGGLFCSKKGVFHVIRDDLLHPLMGGNKLRKLDALMPLLQSSRVTDVITCGGCQSGHAAALAVACAESGLHAHLLLRGEKLAVPTGYNLISGMYGEVTYVSRSEYVERDAMLTKHANFVAGEGMIVETKHMILHSDGAFKERQLVSDSKPSKKVAIVKEGASDVTGLLGSLRLVKYISQPLFLGSNRKVQLVIDCGTGTTAIGVALAILILRLPWKVIGVMLVGGLEDFRNVERRLLDEFNETWHAGTDLGITQEALATCLEWVSRPRPRRFGQVLEGEIHACQRVARETGILLDPLYTLAAWEVATDLAGCSSEAEPVVMLHTGGALNLFGVAQSYASQF